MNLTMSHTFNTIGQQVWFSLPVCASSIKSNDRIYEIMGSKEDKV